MLWRVAFKTLVFDIRKLAVGIIGVIFSIVLANIQGGLFWGLIEKASILIERSNADIWVGHVGMHNVDFPSDIPVRWSNRLRGISGIETVNPVIIGFSQIALPGGGREGVVVVGVEPDNSSMRPWETRPVFPDPLDSPNAIILDEYDTDKLGESRKGDIRQIGDMRATVAGKSKGILSFLVTPYVFTTLDRAKRYTGKDSTACSYLLVRVRPGINQAKICDEIEKRLPYCQAYTSKEFAAVSTNFWLTRTGIGVSFGAATVLGLFVGLAMVSQSLYAHVLDRLQEFATLKALGATEREILQVLLAQAAWIAAGGILLGVAISFVVWYLFHSPKTPILLSPSLLGMSALIVFLMCLLASLAPYVRIRKIDPHLVLQG
jgi:putative ABC transport system permease protein